MAWTDSRVLGAFMTDSFAGTALFDINSHTINVSLNGTGATPDKNAVSASTAYNTGGFATDKLTDTGTSAPAGWPTVGRPLVTPSCTFATGTVTFDAVDTASANAVTTITAAFGCLVYDDTLASPVIDQGICFNYFGGTQTVTLGTLTLVWHTSGIFTVTFQMAVYCRQVDDNDQTYVIEPHSDDQTDFELLTAKYNGAQDKGWTVEWTDQMTFVAKKVRWADVTCTRTFWVE